MYHPGTWYVPSLVFQYLVYTYQYQYDMYTTVVRRFARALVGAYVRHVLFWRSKCSSY